MNSNWKQICISTIIVVAGVVLIDLLVGIACTKSLEAMPHFGGQINKINYVLNRMDADIAVIGSSRAAHHYKIEVLRDSLNRNGSEYKTYFNAGIDGYFTNCSFCVFESMLNRCTPKAVIIDINPEEFYQYDGYDNSRIELFSPFYGTNAVVKDYLDRLGAKERLMMISNLYRFNRIPLRLAKGMLSNRLEWDGYEPLFDSMQIITQKETEGNVSAYSLSSYTIENFQRVVDLANKKSVKLIFAVSPCFRCAEDGIQIVSKLCEDNNVPFVNMCSDSYFNDHPELFKDMAHLNDNGATLYSSRFITNAAQYL